MTDDQRGPLAPQVEWLVQQQATTSADIAGLKEGQHMVSDVLQTSFGIRPGSERADARDYMIKASRDTALLEDIRKSLQTLVKIAGGIGLLIIIAIIMRQLGMKDIIGDVGNLSGLIH